MKLRQVEYCGGTADIMKFFDQIPRQLVYEMCERAGMPKQIIGAYKAYQESLAVRNGISGALGKPYRKKASVPQ